MISMNFWAKVDYNNRLAELNEERPVNKQLEGCERCSVCCWGRPGTLALEDVKKNQ